MIHTCTCMCIKSSLFFVSFVSLLYVISIIVITGVFLVLEETLPKTNKIPRDSSDNVSVTTNIEMLTLNGETDPSDNDSNTLFEEEFSDIDALLETDNNKTIQIQPATPLHTGRTLQDDSWYYPFTHFCLFQKQQCIKCCYCCVSTKSSHEGPISHRSVYTKIKDGLLMRLRLFWDRRVILTVVTYGLVGGVTILSNEVSY